MSFTALREKPRRFIPLLVVTTLSLCAAGAAAADQASTPNPALSVELTSPRSERIPQLLLANGDIAAWQEATVSSDIAGLRLLEIRADVGDRVHAGQVLAVFDDASVKTEVAQAEASLEQARTALIETQDNAQRAKQLQDSGALSAQQISRYLTEEKAARSQVLSAKAALKAQQLRLKYTLVRAPDDGIISSRTATIGTVAGIGFELFRLIRQGRLEWRAEVASADLPYLKPGMSVQITTASGAKLEGKLRLIAPTVNAQTRNALVYTDLPPLPAVAKEQPKSELSQAAPVLPGMFAHGEFNLGKQSVLAIPQQALVIRDGFTAVFVLGEDSRVKLIRVQSGTLFGENIAILSGLDPNSRVVARGGVFLNDGDLVRVLTDAPAGQ